jgi:hypothetical protein
MASRLQGFWINPIGTAMAGGFVYICTQPNSIDPDDPTIPPSPLASLFTDSTGTVPLANPVVVDGNGNWFAYLDPGSYTLVFYDPLGRLTTPAVFPDIVNPTPGGGSVSSVGLSMPGEFAVANSPVTGSGTITVTKQTQNALTVYAGPSSGPAAQPAFINLSTLLAAIGVGSGTVTSVGIVFNGGSLFTVSSTGGPITSAGNITISVDFNNQNANLVLAGPTSGGAGPVTARALVAADIPGFLLQKNVVMLATADIEALMGTPFTLVPAQGANTIIVPVAVILEMIGGTIAFTDAGGAVSLVMGSAAVALGTNAIFTTAVSQTQIQRLAGFAATDTAAAPPTDINAPLQMSKITNNFAAGNGSMKVTTIYLVVGT